MRFEGRRIAAKSTALAAVCACGVAVNSATAQRIQTLAIESEPARMAHPVRRVGEVWHDTGQERRASTLTERFLWGVGAGFLSFGLAAQATDEDAGHGMGVRRGATLWTRRQVPKGQGLLP